MQFLLLSYWKNHWTKYWRKQQIDVNMHNDPIIFLQKTFQIKVAYRRAMTDHVNKNKNNLM